jgi:hypothetical protein
LASSPYIGMVAALASPILNLSVQAKA